MRKHTRCWILIVIGLLTLLNLAPSMDIYAQQIQSLLIIGRGGELWSWSSTATKVTQLTSSKGNVGQFSRSPDGKKIAYKVLPTSVTEWITKEQAAGAGDGAFEGQLPEDIRILDLESHQDILIAGQSPVNPDSPLGKGAVKRSIPSWSPDGRSLVWLEDSSYEDLGPDPNAVQGTGTFFPDYHLIIYDYETKARNDIALNMGYPGAPLWGPLGIFLRVGDDAYLYSEKGKILATFQTHPISPVLWVKDGAKDYVAVRSDFDKYGGWFYFDVSTGEIADISGQLEMYSLTAPDGFSFVQETDDFLLKFCTQATW